MIVRGFEWVVRNGLGRGAAGAISSHSMIALAALARPLFLLALFSGAGSSVASAADPATPAPWVQQHVHQFVSVPVQQWVPAKTRRIEAGKDDKGRPIYRDIIVQKGYFKTVHVQKCKLCGASRG